MDDINLDEYWILAYNESYDYVLLNQVPGQKITLKIKLLLIDMRPNLHEYSVIGNKILSCIYVLQIWRLEIDVVEEVP